MIWLFLSGVLSGIISGMGIGGGAILIPALSIFFDMPQKAAQSINLIYFIPTAIAALCGHIKNKRVEAQNLKALIPAGIVGAVVGSFAALQAGNELLRTMFGVFLLVMGIREIYMGIKGGKNNGNR